jgi:hypothetical protein
LELGIGLPGSNRTKGLFLKIDFPGRKQLAAAASWKLASGIGNWESGLLADVVPTDGPQKI